MVKKNVFGVYLLGALALMPSVPTMTEAYGSSYSVEASDAEAVPVKGKVVNERGETLPGVNVFVKGSGKGTVADGNGNFSINIPADAQLVFSYIGYLSIERKLLPRV